MNFYPKPINPDKGKFDGSCNRQSCQAPGARWWNNGTLRYYCEQCAHQINRACADFCAEHGPILTKDDTDRTKVQS